MQIDVSLYEAQDICLAPIDHEKDPEIEAKWTQDASYLRLLDESPARPKSSAHVKKLYEKLEKKIEENKNLFYFTIRMRSDDRLIGFIKLQWIEWSIGVGSIQMGIGEAQDRLRGYGTQALNLAIRYAFAELNLYRLNAAIPEYNPIALHVFKKAGLVEEVRRRQALYRDGKRWDMFHLGLLKDEWQYEG